MMSLVLVKMNPNQTKHNVFQAEAKRKEFHERFVVCSGRLAATDWSELALQQCLSMIDLETAQDQEYLTMTVT